MLSFMVVLQKTFFLQNCYKFLSSTANVHYILWMLVKTTFNEYPQFMILSKKWVKLMFNLCKPHFSPYKMMDLLTWYYRFLWKNMTQFYFSETIVDYYMYYVTGIPKIFWWYLAELYNRTRQRVPYKNDNSALLTFAVISLCYIWHW